MSLTKANLFRGLALGSFAVWVLSCAALRAAEPNAPPSADQVQAWVKQLSAEDFQKREEARAALSKAGAAALPALNAAKNAQDPEVRNAVALLIAQLQWRNLRKDVQYLSLFPSNSLAALQVKSLAGSLERSRQTALGKLLEGPEFKPLMDLAANRMKQQGGAGLEIVLKWLKRFNGQVGAAVWSFDPNNPQLWRMGVIAELTGDAPDKLYDEFLGETKLFQGGAPALANGLTVLKGPNDLGAVTLAGRHVIFAPNMASLEELASGLLEPTPDNLLAAPAFAKLKAKLPADAELTFLFNFQAYLRMLGNIAGPQIGQVMKDMGYDALEQIAMTTTVAGDRFEDRFVVSVSDKPSKFLKLISMGMGPTPLKEALAVAPAEAVLAGTSYLDGAVAYEFLLGYIKDILQMQRQMGMPVPDPEQVLGQFEQLAGLKVAELSGAVKGDLVYWVKLAPDLAPPEIGFSLGCADEVKAKMLAETLPKLLDLGAVTLQQRAAGRPRPGAPKKAGEEEKKAEAEPPAPLPALPPATTKAERNGRAIFTESEEGPLVKVPGRAAVPYRLSWAAYGARLIVATSPAAVEARLAALDAKLPGFDPARVLPQTPETATAKTLFALDVAALLDYGAKYALPILLANLEKDPELQGVVKGLYEKQGLFKTVPPLAGTAWPLKEGIQTSVIWGPSPYIATVVGVGATAATLFARQAMGRRGPVAPPKAPAGVQF